MCVYSIYIYKRGETAGDCVGDNQSVANLDLHFAASVLYNIPKVLGAKKKNGCNDTSEPRKPSEYLQVFGHKTMHTLLSGLRIRPYSPTSSSSYGWIENNMEAYRCRRTYNRP